VGSFPRGMAECGAQDMSGSVWEWTASLYDKDRDWYVVRGGSWSSGRGSARVADRFGYFPYDSPHHRGFRLAAPVF
jgi:formylglycine-generating enzyme required for sulfatase activity